MLKKSGRILAALLAMMMTLSAVGTVGISAIGTANLRPLARLLIIITMYIGRIGPLTMALLFTKRQSRARELVQYPEDRVMLG